MCFIKLLGHCNFGGIRIFGIHQNETSMEGMFLHLWLTKDNLQVPWSLQNSANPFPLPPTACHRYIDKIRENLHVNRKKNGENLMYNGAAVGVGT